MAGWKKMHVSRHVSNKKRPRSSTGSARLRSRRELNRLRVAARMAATRKQMDSSYLFVYSGLKVGM